MCRTSKRSPRYFTVLSILERLPFIYQCRSCPNSLLVRLVFIYSSSSFSRILYIARKRVGKLETSQPVCIPFHVLFFVSPSGVLPTSSNFASSYIFYNLVFIFRIPYLEPSNRRWMQSKCKPNESPLSSNLWPTSL